MILLRQTVMNGHRALKRHALQLQAGAAAQREHGFIKNAAYNIDVPAQIPQDLPGVFQRVFKGYDLEFHVRADFIDLRPQLHQKLGGRHGRRADTDDIGVFQHGVLSPRHRILTIVNDVFGVLIQAASGLGQRQPAMGAVKELHPQRFLQQVDLLDDGGRRDVGFLCGLAEAARVGCPQKVSSCGLYMNARLLLLGGILSILYIVFRKDCFGKHYNVRVYAHQPTGTSSKSDGAL